LTGGRLRCKIPTMIGGRSSSVFNICTHTNQENLNFFVWLRLTLTDVYPMWFHNFNAIRRLRSFMALSSSRPGDGSLLRLFGQLFFSSWYLLFASWLFLCAIGITFTRGRDKAGPVSGLVTMTPQSCHGWYSLPRPRLLTVRRKCNNVEQHRRGYPPSFRRVRVKPTPSCIPGICAAGRSECSWS